MRFSAHIAQSRELRWLGIKPDTLYNRQRLSGTPSHQHVLFSELWEMGLTSGNRSGILIKLFGREAGLVTQKIRKLKKVLTSGTGCDIL